GRMKFVGAAAETTQLRPRGIAIRGLGKTHGTKRQYLIGAKRQPPGKLALHRDGFLARQQRRHLTRRWGDHATFQTPISKILMTKAGRFEHGPAAFALQREKEGGAGKP